MKPKQSKNSNKSSNNNKRGHKQQQQQQQSDQQQQQKQNVTDDVITSHNDDVSVTSSTTECPDAENIPSTNNNSDKNHLHSPGVASDHDLEVAGILHSPVTSFDPEVAAAEVTPDVGQVTELIMAKTFTESTQPGREFVPVSYTHLTLPTIYSV